MSESHSPPTSDASMTASYNTRIGLITDIHSDYSNYSVLRAELINTIEAIEDANADHIVVLGDLIEGDDTAEATRQHFKDIKTILTDTTDIPVTILRGNHDVVTANGEQVRDIPTDCMGTIDLGNDITGIYLDTSTPQWPDARGTLTENQLGMLENALTRADTAVIFSHHPLYYHDIREDNHFAEHPEAAFCHAKYRAQEIITKHDNVIAAANGHTHITDCTEYNGTPYFTVNAFNNEKPGAESINGSFELLDVSKREVKRIKHTHGEFDGVDTVTYPLGDKKVALGGTFGPIHDGHRQMFRRAFEIGDVRVGVTSDEFAVDTRHEPRQIPAFEDRIHTLEEELDQLADTYDREYETVELTEPSGGVTTNPDITHLIVSPETFSRGETLNEERLANGLEPLEIEIVEPVLADDGRRISSTRIVNGEIDEHGRVTTDDE